MNTKKVKSVESQGDSASVKSASDGLMNVPVTVPVGKKGNGQSYLIWGRKDLGGKPSNMAGKDGDRVVNKGDIVKDPETGQDVYLIRIHRGKRVWYSKGSLDVPVLNQTEE